MEQEIKRNIPRDLFLHLLAVVTLYWSAISFVTLLWQFINKFFPDVLKDMYVGDRLGLIRFSVSALIIVFPVFIFISRYLNTIYRREAVVRESKIRKWLIYLTLFIAALVIIGDLVSVINMLMSGEITIRFILKALSVLAVAAIVFWYYLDDVRRETPTDLAKYFAWVTGTLVLAVIIGGIIIAGTPATARLQAFDEQKINDLQNIQYQIVNYWQRKQVMLTNLSVLSDSISGFKVPVDPQSNANYEYTVTSATMPSFELCAVFNKASQEKIATPYYAGPEISQNWNHVDGRVCFERTIDKQLYPPLTK